MEKVSTGPLIKGTLAKVKKQAKLKGFLKKNLEPNVSKYLESLIYGDLK